MRHNPAKQPDKQGSARTRALITRPGNVSPKPVMTLLMAPLSIGMILISLVIASYMVIQQKNSLNESNRALMQLVSLDLQRALAEQSKALIGTANALLQNESLRKALKARDRKSLLAEYSPLFTRLKADDNISHFYFIDSERLCLLRLHNPAQYGDRIDRFTAREAERTGKPTSGIELGTLGTFTLRLVQPVFDGKTRIGYLELGLDIADILAAIHKHPGIEVAATIHKSALKRETWEEGMKILGYDHNWERFADDVLVYSSLSPLPVEAEPIISEQYHVDFDASGDIRTMDAASWQIIKVALRDASGSKVGGLIIFRDISKLKADLRWMVAMIGGGTLVTTAGLLVFLFIILRRTDATITSQYAALQENEQHLQSLLSNSPAVIYTCRPSGDYGATFISSNVLRQIGYEASDFLDVTGFWAAHIHPDDAPRIFAATTALFEKGSHVHEYRFRNKNGDWRWMHDEMILIRNAAGEPVEILGSWLDITERKQAEEAIRQTLKEKEILLREVNHRVKNNLAVISGLLDLQSSRIEDSSMKSLFNESRQRIKSMAMVHERLYNGTNLSQIDFTDYINRLVKDLIYSYSNDGRQHTTKVSVKDIMLDITTAIPCGLIINELITNIMKYAFPKKISGEIHISFTKSSDLYTLIVSDNGIGLPEGFDHTKTDTLGLQLVQALTGQLRGTMKIQSDTDQGTEVIITFTEQDGGNIT